MTTDEPKSTRWPWLRGGLVGLITTLAPFVWVVDVDSCATTPVAQELTGVDVFAKMRFDALPEGVVMALVLLGVVALPFIARRRTAGVRLWLHAAGLLTTGFFAWGLFLVLFFALFSSRALKGAGYLVASAVVVAVADALGRVGLGAREWWRSRSSTT